MSAPQMDCVEDIKEGFQMAVTKIKRNVAVSKEEAPRKEWPFVDMKVGDVVEITERDDWLPAAKYSHNVASKHGMKMQTRWLEEKGLGRIRRIS